MKGLTKRQREIVDFIEEFIGENNYSPSYREIMEHFNFASLGSVYKHVNVLKRKGILMAEKSSARSMALVEHIPQSPSASRVVDIPFLGQIAAGIPIETFPQAGMMTIPATLVPHPARSYVLQVKGDSMIDDHITDGDLVIVEGRDSALPGETVVALVHGSETTLKKYYPRTDDIELRPANGDFESIYVSPRELKIQGVLLGLVRKY